MSAAFKAYSDLSIREAVLGVLRTKDENDTRVIHTSDFRNAISELGLSFASKTVQNVLVHCKMDNEGNINFSNLEAELARERSLFNVEAQAKPIYTTIPTSSAAVSTPWRTDVIHEKKISSELQTKRVQQYRPLINDLYSKLSHHMLDDVECVRILEEYEIFPTKEFLRILGILKVGEVSLSDFILSLTKYDQSYLPLNPQDSRTAGTTIKQKSGYESLGTYRRRFNTAATSSYFQTVDKGDFEDVRTGKKIKHNKFNVSNILHAPPSPPHNPSEGILAGDESTGSIHDILFGGENDSNENANLSQHFLSHAQSDMIHGLNGRNVNLSFNSEERLQRDQILAALRKLDSGELSMDDFQDKVFSMGFELPQTIARDLYRCTVSGRLDLNKAVKTMDAVVFKAKAIEDRLAESDHIDELKQAFSDAVKKMGVDSLLKITMKMQEYDTDGDGCLSFQEFKRCCLGDLRIESISESDLRRLFNAFDSNGDGQLQFEEFLTAIRGSKMNAFRNRAIVYVFRQFDKYGEGRVMLDTLCDAYDSTFYAKNVLKSSVKASMNDFVNWFVNKKDFDGFVSLQDFTEYYQNISAIVEPDALFQTLMVHSWPEQDPSREPPPPQQKQLSASSKPLKRGQDSAMPVAKQYHGDVITWSQAPSALESKKNSPTLNKWDRRVAPGHEMKNLHTDVISWNKYQNPGFKPHEQNAVTDDFDFRPFGGIKVSKSNRKNESSANNLLFSSVNTSSKSRAQLSSNSFDIVDIQKLDSMAIDSNSRPFQNEYPTAGAKSIKIESPQKLGKRFQNPFPSVPMDTNRAPFGVNLNDAAPSSTHTRAGSQPPLQQKSPSQPQIRSLADTLRAKKGTAKPLSSMVRTIQ